MRVSLDISTAELLKEGIGINMSLSFQISATQAFQMGKPMLQDQLMLEDRSEEDVPRVQPSCR